MADEMNNSQITNDQNMNGQMMNNGMNQMNGQMMNNGMNQMNGQMNNGMNQMMPINNQVTTINEEPEPFDEKALLAKMEREMVNSAEVQSLVQSIDYTNFDAITLFGKEAMVEMGRAGDEALQGETRAAMADGKTISLIADLKKLFGQINPNELKNDKLGWFGNLQKKIEAFISKYQKISVDIDKIYVQLKQYEETTREGNRKLAIMYEADLRTFHDLKLYIFAAEQCSVNLKKEIEIQKEKKRQTGDEKLVFVINQLDQAEIMMEEQYMRLKSAQAVALQTLPQLNIQQVTNYNILGQINEAFLFTLPILKQAIAQAIMVKRQKNITDSMADFNKMTNELMVRNAENIVETATKSMEMSQNSAISVETLEKTWNTIMNGIEKVNDIQEKGRKDRVENSKKLDALKNDFYAKLGVPSKPTK